MGKKRTLEAGKTATSEQALVAPAKQEPARKISAVWLSDDPRKNAGHTCTKCRSRGSSF